jgi:hypothetical protein
MNIGNLFVESYAYTREALWGRWRRWILLLISTIIFPLIYGYLVKIMQGRDPAPEPRGWGRLFIDGIVLWVIYQIYAIPVVIVAGVTIGWGSILLLMEQAPGEPPIAALGTLVFGMIITLLVALIMAFFSNIGAIRFARTGRVSEAFRIGTISAHIRRIGWVPYASALVVIYLLLFLVIYVLSITLIGLIFLVLLSPGFSIFFIRYITLLYESAPAPS